MISKGIQTKKPPFGGFVKSLRLQLYSVTFSSLYLTTPAVCWGLIHPLMRVFTTSAFVEERHYSCHSRLLDYQNSV